MAQRVTAAPTAPVASDQERFFVLDFGLSYRLPRHRGLVSLAVKNLVNEWFSYQDLNVQTAREILTPRFIPGRSLFLSLTLAFD